MEEGTWFVDDEVGDGWCGFLDFLGEGFRRGFLGGRKCDGFVTVWFCGMRNGNVCVSCSGLRYQIQTYISILLQGHVGLQSCISLFKPQRMALGGFV